MKRIIILTGLLCTLLFGGEGFGFKEERYVYSIDKTLSFTGHIEFSENGMNIEYTKPEKKRIEYTQTHLKIFDAAGELAQEIDLEADPGMKLYMQLLLWLYRGDIEALQRYFTVNKKGDELHLDPIAPTDKVVTSVTVVQKEGKPSFIKTMMSNQNEISIDIAR